MSLPSQLGYGFERVSARRVSTDIPQDICLRLFPCASVDWYHMLGLGVDAGLITLYSMRSNIVAILQRQSNCRCERGATLRYLVTCPLKSPTHEKFNAALAELAIKVPADLWQRACFVFHSNEIVLEHHINYVYKLIDNPRNKNEETSIYIKYNGGTANSALPAANSAHHRMGELPTRHS